MKSNQIVVKEIGNPQLSEKKLGLILRNFSFGTLAKLSQIIFLARTQKAKIREIIFGTLGGTCFNKMNKFEEENFEVGYWTNNSPVNLDSFWEQMNEGYRFVDENFKVSY